jgi:hypothetical protein
MEEIVKQTEQTPRVEFGQNSLVFTGHFDLSDSYPYVWKETKNITEFIEQKIQKQELDQIDIKLAYISRESVDELAKIVSVSINQENLDPEINWYFEEEDESHLEKGELFQIFLKTPIKFVMVQ